MQSISTILVTLGISILTFLGMYNVVPSNLTGLGSIVEISSTDNLSSFPAVYNANLSQLMRMATTSVNSIVELSNLSTIGTIATGTWNADTLTVPYGGTGSTTLSAYQVLIGNGTGNIGVVSGVGTSGQFLTSNGAGANPTWQTSAVNQADDYTWTGEHTFNGTTTVAATNSSGGLSPVGSITAYASSTPPTGWLSADGTAVSRTTYVNLFNIIGTTYGVGDGSTTFNLPNLLGRNILMASTTVAMAQSGGESNHTMTTDELVAHTHVIAGASDNTGGSLISAIGATPSARATESAGSSNPFNVLDPYLTAWYIIKY